MRKVLILGANGQVARYAIDLFLKNTDARLTLYLRTARRLKTVESTEEAFPGCQAVPMTLTEPGMEFPRLVSTMMLAGPPAGQLKADVAGDGTRVWPFRQLSVAAVIVRQVHSGRAAEGIAPLTGGGAPA